MSDQTRVSTKKSSFIPTQGKFSPPPVLQPKAEKKPDAKLPEWKPGGGGATNPVQRLLDKAVQAKLTIGQPGDADEQEADRVSSQVMSMSAPADSSASVQLSTNNPNQIWQEAQSIADKMDRNKASGDLENPLNASKGGGSPLSEPVRRFMEPRFGADFSSVRVHTGSSAVQMNQELGAQAFTHGSDVYFGAGKSPGNNELTAHELTHVVQQMGASKIQTNKSDDTLQNQIIQRQDQEYTTTDAARSVGEYAAFQMEVEGILRKMYLRGDAAIRAEAQAMVATGKSEREAAKWAVKARNELRRTIRKKGHPIVDAIARAKRGAKDMPTYESLKARGKTDAQIIESAGRSNVKANRWVGRLRIAGRIFIALDLGIAGYNIATAPEVDRPKVIAREIGSRGGALAGGWAGAKGGAAVGGFIGSFFGPVLGTAIGAGIGGLIGGIGGAIGGGWAGSKAAEWTIDQFYPPSETYFEQSQ